jgi:hypothetical protein
MGKLENAVNGTNLIQRWSGSERRRPGSTTAHGCICNWRVEALITGLGIRAKTSLG